MEYLLQILSQILARTQSLVSLFCFNRPLAFWMLKTEQDLSFTLLSSKNNSFIDTVKALNSSVALY